MNNVTVLPVDETLKPAFQAPPEQVHPGQIGYVEADNSPALKRASDLFQFAWDKSASLNELRTTPDPEDKPATHFRKVREAVDSFEHNWGRSFDETKAALKSELVQVEAGLERAANLKPVAHHFDAVTSTFHNMTPAQRSQALDQLIEQGDGPTLASLIEAPLFITGLTAEQRDGIKLRVFTKVDPAGLKLRDKLARALVKMEAASMAGFGMRDKLREGTDRFTARRKQAEEAANRARTGFAA